ncbi:MAG: polyprenyl synthetase family protein [Anaerolineaceae bacterium]
MTTSTLNLPVVAEIAQVETLMRKQAENHHPDLQSALNLLLDSGGKRIRPSITILVGRLLGGDIDRLITLAAAIEMLHTATLVHDDLIDGALLRRGTPTLNSQWSPAATVLTGDFLFARAAILAAETNAPKVIRVFANTLGIIVNGEITQLFSSRCNPSREDYYQRIYAKTASLFETSTTTAAMISAADDIAREQMRRYGYEIGIAFQIIDDILDFTADQKTFGKPVGEDLRQGLITLPALYYFERNPNDPSVRAVLDGNCEIMKARVNDLIQSIRQSDAIHRAYEEATQHVQIALEQ